MHANRIRFFRSCVAAIGLALLGVATFGFASSARALDPKSPEIVAMVKKACAFLEKPEATSQHYGGHCVMAYALLKAGYPADHPKVQEAVKMVQARLATGKDDELDDHGDESIYSPCTALILLCELDEQQHSQQIQKLLDFILKRQHSSGCWGYARTPSVGDTSQQQYAILALWTADYSGFQVPPDAMERALGWLIRVQDPNGFYAYNPTDPKSLQRIQQPASTFRVSLQSAAAGSLYIAGDFFRLTPTTVQENEDVLPPALRIVKTEVARPGAPPILKEVSEDVYRERTAAADAAFARQYAMETLHQYYYFYTLERYMSFRELATGGKNARWYDEVAAWLKTRQRDDGSWFGMQAVGPGVETAFAVLFLTRSTAKSIQKKIQREGLLLGGVGLPTDTTNVRIRGGRVVGMELSKNLDDLIELLESENAQEDVELLAQQIEELEIVPGARLDEAQTARLNRLAGHPSYEVRILAVKAMMRSRDVRVAPALIYALSDPDDRVKQAATEALRFISRRFDGVPLPASPSPLEVERAQEEWRAWYRAVAPPGSPVQ